MPGPTTIAVRVRDEVERVPAGTTLRVYLNRALEWLGITPSF